MGPVTRKGPLLAGNGGTKCNKLVHYDLIDFESQSEMQFGNMLSASPASVCLRNGLPFVRFGKTVEWGARVSVCGQHSVRVCVCARKTTESRMHAKCAVGHQLRADGIIAVRPSHQLCVLFRLIGVAS